MIEKDVYTQTINEDGHITEHKQKVVFDDNGKEIARGAVYTLTISPGDPTNQKINAGERTKALVDTVHTPEVVAIYKTKMTELSNKKEF